MRILFDLEKVKKMKKKMNGLTLAHGDIKDYKGIKCKNNKWIFTNDDPQIYICFHNDIRCLLIDCNIAECNDEMIYFQLYWRKRDGQYTEESSYEYVVSSDENMQIQIEFEEPVREIRFDPSRKAGFFTVNSIYFNSTQRAGLYEKAILNSIKRKEVDEEEKLIVVTHELSRTGAPILAYHIVKEMVEMGKQVILMSHAMGDEYFIDQYEKLNVPILYLDKEENNHINCVKFTGENNERRISVNEFRDILFKVLNKQGYKNVITNTYVAGEGVELFSNNGFKIVSLIHEMKTSIELLGLYERGKQIADNSDYVVFPNQYVEADFIDVFGEIRGESLIRPQGLYLYEAMIRKNREKKEIRNEFGFDEDDILIMSSGVCDLRKGVDLFLEAAVLFNMYHKNPKVKFVWIGHFNDVVMKKWFENQIIKYKLPIVFMEFIDDIVLYKELLSSADLFWAMSREDPFPSTVLDAMDSGLIVFGFKKTGGIETMLLENRGVLVEEGDLPTLVQETNRVIENRTEYIDMINKAAEYISSLDFNKYIYFLNKLITK